MNNLPSILDEIKDSLSSLCQDNNWELTKAVDPFHTYDILFQNRGRGVMVVGYAGDAVHQQVCRSVVSKAKFSVTLSTRRDLTNPLGGIISRDDSKISLLEMVEEVKQTVLGFSVSNGLSENNPRYDGTAPLSTPDGIPLDAYQISFWVYAANAPEPEDAFSESSGD